MKIVLVVLLIVLFASGVFAHTGSLACNSVGNYELDCGTGATVTVTNNGTANMWFYFNYPNPGLTIVPGETSSVRCQGVYPNFRLTCFVGVNADIVYDETVSAGVSESVKQYSFAAGLLAAIAFSGAAAMRW